MNAIISNGDYTASVQLPVERKQLAGALSYLGKNHASAYDIKYNEESDQGLSNNSFSVSSTLLRTNSFNSLLTTSSFSCIIFLDIFQISLRMFVVVTSFYQSFRNMSILLPELF